jgi:uncharacterized membrane protein required for colicin V production
MGIIVDLIIIAIIVLSTFLAYRKGLVKLALGLCSFIIAIVLTFIFYQPVSNLVINVTRIDETIENAIYEKANNIMKENETDSELTNQIIETTKNEMLPETARTLATNIVRGGVILILFVAIKIALRFITALADAIAKLPILNQINKAGGIVYGILRGILIIYVALLILTIPGQINPNNTVNQSVDQSFLGKTMYQNNILNVFF